jgi:anti-anti-sigma factor
MMNETADQTRKVLRSMAHFEATTSADAGDVVVSLVGECDLSGREELTSALLAAVESSRVVVVDLARLTFIDSSGLHGLVTGHQAAVRSGGRLYAVNAGGAVAAVLDLTGVGELLSPPADSGVPYRPDPQRPSDGAGSGHV